LPSVTNDCPFELPPAVLLQVDKLLTLPMSLVVLTTVTVPLWLDSPAPPSKDSPCWLLLAAVVAVARLMLAVWIVALCRPLLAVFAGTPPLLLLLLVALLLLLTLPLAEGVLFCFLLACRFGPLHWRFLANFELFPLDGFGMVWLLGMRWTVADLLLACAACWWFKIVCVAWLSSCSSGQSLSGTGPAGYPGLQTGWRLHNGLDAAVGVQMHARPVSLSRWVTSTPWETGSTPIWVPCRPSVCQIASFCSVLIVCGPGSARNHHSFFLLLVAAAAAAATPAGPRLLLLSTQNCRRHRATASLPPPPP